MNLNMDETRLKQILEHFPEVSILVIGDFFLDNYLILERELSEISLETGLEAYQVVGTHKNPGAAGTITANLRALDVMYWLWVSRALTAMDMNYEKSW